MDEDFGPDIDFSAIAAEPAAKEVPSAALLAAARQVAPIIPSVSRIQQPTPRALPSRSGPSSITVSVRQKGNPILALIRSLPWEYGDIPSDYMLGNTTCALFLSLKYHRLHPEYIYGRIRALGQKFNLRVLLTMVDIQNHEDSLKELSKTSLINNLTLVLCWSAQEAARYLELFKSYEHASPTSIRAHQATSYSEKLVEFITVPRSINKTDAYGLVSAFGSVRASVNARPEEISGITGWGEKKVERWCETVRQPFRVRKAARKGAGDKAGGRIGLSNGESSATGIQESRSVGGFQRENSTRNDGMFQYAEAGTMQNEIPNLQTRNSPSGQVPLDARKTSEKRPAQDDVQSWLPDEDEEALFLAAVTEAEAEGGPVWPNNAPERDGESSLPRGSEPFFNSEKGSSSQEAGLSEGMMVALAKLRKE